MEKKIDETKKGSLLQELLKEVHDNEIVYEELSDEEKIEEEKVLNKLKKLFL